ALALRPVSGFFDMTRQSNFPGRAATHSAGPVASEAAGPSPRPAAPGRAVSCGYRIDADHHFVCLTPEGAGGIAACAETLRAAAADPRVGGDYAVLVYLRVAGEPPSYGQLRALADATARA